MTQLDIASWRAQQSRQLVHQGHSVFIKEAGTGSALLCLHGYPYSSWQWRKLWPSLLEHYRVIAPDMIGCGFSDKPRDFNYSIMAQTDLMIDLLAQLGVTEVHVLAHDYGVSIAQEMLARNLAGERAPRVRSVCFLNGGLLPEKFRERMEHRLIRLRGMQVALLFDGQSFVRSIGALYAAGTRPSDAELKQDWEVATCNGGLFVADKIFHFLEERIEKRERWVGALQKSEIPLRLINGSADPIAGAAMAEHYSEIVSKADVVSLPGIGHFPHLECPEQVLASFDAFQKRIA
jgi:pimeloyl-ACP methyl ester carboxylesterase